MRGADRGPRQTVERRHMIDARFRARLGFQQPGGMGTVQEGQHRDLLAGDNRQRQEDRACRRKTARRRGPRQIFAQTSNGHHRRRQRHQRESRGAGRDDLRRFMTTPASQEQISRNRHAADHNGDIRHQRGARHAHIGQGAERDQPIQGAMEIVLVLGPDLADGNDHIGQARARRQRQHRQERRQAVRPAARRGEAGVEHARARQPGEQKQQQGQRHPARRGMTDQHAKAAGDQCGGGDQRAHRGAEDGQLAVVG